MIILILFISFLCLIAGLCIGIQVYEDYQLIKYGEKSLDRKFSNWEKELVYRRNSPQVFCFWVKDLEKAKKENKPFQFKPSYLHKMVEEYNKKVRRAKK